MAVVLSKRAIYACNPRFIRTALVRWKGFGQLDRAEREPSMPLAPGQRLGIYEVVAPLGAGGMGEVYRAPPTSMAQRLVIVQNWFEELTRRVPTN